MNSRIYECKVAHVRERPRRNAFTYSTFMLYLDLDELDSLHKEISLFSYNRWNVFSFHDKDHFIFTRNKDRSAELILKEKAAYTASRYTGKGTKERIITLVKELKLGFRPHKVYMLTLLRHFGYVFNPVSFYYCFDKEGRFRALFSEVNNTYKQQKMYYLLIKDPSARSFKDRQRKNYYISPFIDYDTDLHWDFTIPGTDLSMVIRSKKKDNTVLKAILKGKRAEITDWKMFSLIFRYPLLTFMIITWIHYQALKLWLKKIPFQDKQSTDKSIIKAISRQ